MTTNGTDTALIPIEHERSVLGACLIDPEAIYTVADILEPADFYRESHRLIYEAFLDLYRGGKPVNDISLVEDRLKRTERLGDAGGLAYLMKLVSVTPTSAHARHYAELVVNAADRRRLERAAGKIAQLAHDQTVDDPVTQALGAVFKTSERNEELTLSEHAWDDYLDLMNKRIESGGVVGAPTGFTDWDNILGGMRKGNMIVIGGRPGMGKTTLAENVADHVAEQGGRVLFASLEMPIQQLLDRRMARWSTIPTRDLERGHVDLRAVTDAIGAMSLTQQIDYLDGSGLTTDKLLATAYRTRSLAGLDLIVVDYLQLLDDDYGMRGNEHQRVSYMSRRLKFIALELDVPVVVLSQLNRGVELRQNKRPTMADLRESGGIEENADSVTLVYRPKAYDPEYEYDVAELIVNKNRNGSPGMATLLCQFEINKLSNLAPAGMTEPNGYRTTTTPELVS